MKLQGIQSWKFLITKTTSTPTPTPTPGPTPTPTSTPTPEPTPTPSKANMKFVDIEPCLVKSLPGPLEPSMHVILVNKNWAFKNSGDTADMMNIYIYELDMYGNILKLLGTYTTDKTIPPNVIYQIVDDLLNNYDFSRRYENGEVIHLAILIWGKDTEEEPSIE